MSYKTLVTMNIAIIGTGKMVESLAEGLALAGHNIYLATKNEDEKINEYLFDEYDNIFLNTIEDAASNAEVIIIATPPEYVREVAYLLDDVRKKVIIDASLIPVERTREYIHSVNAIKAITSSPFVIRCFNCTDYNDLFESKLKNRTIDMFVAGDSKKAKAMARALFNCWKTWQDSGKTLFATRKEVVNLRLNC